MNKSNTIGMKTAISIPDDLFKEVNTLARKNKTSRSQIFRTAVEEYLEKLKSHKLLEAINSAYANEETSEEMLLRKKSIEYYNSTILKKKNDDQTG
jgi:metal-responsive CopG/Arc/MetJ family transcriptional regulator